MWRRYLQIVCVSVVLGDFIAACTLIAILRHAEWHNHLLQFAAASGIAFLGLEGSSSHGFISPIFVSIFTIIGSIIVIRHLHGVAVMKTRWWEATIIALTTFTVLTLFVYVPQFTWEVVKTAYVDHTNLAARVKHLQSYAANEEQFQRDLLEAQATAADWREAYTGISKGETKPDRVLNSFDTEHLRTQLVDYAKYSGDRKYSTVKIAPAFYDDQESLQFANQLLTIFANSHWSARWEGPHSKALTTLLNLSRPVGEL
jgi:hypothetical protein